MPDAAIPSIGAAIAATLAAAPEGETSINPIEHLVKKPDAVAKVEPLPEKKEPVEAKGLSNFQSDELPEKAKPEVSPDEPSEGEKPAQFIKRLKQERNELREQLKLATKPKSAESSAEVDQLRRELAERDALLESTAFEKSRKFQDQFSKPYEKAANAAKDLIGKFTEAKGVFEQARALDGRERMEFLKEHVGDAAGTVYDRLARMDEIAGDREAALKDRAEMTKTLAAERAAHGEHEVLKAFEGRREDMAKKLSVYRGDNAEALAATARSLITGEASADDVVAAAYLAAAAPVYIAQNRELRSEIATLKARIAEYDGDKPAINGRGADGGDAGNKFIKDGRIRSMEEVLKMQMNGAS